MWSAIYIRTVLLTPAPDLAYVIGVPVGLMAVAGALAIAIYVVIGKTQKG